MSKEKRFLIRVITDVHTKSFRETEFSFEQLVLFLSEMKLGKQVNIVRLG